MSYALLLSRPLDADWSVIAKSGGGVVHDCAAPWPSDKPLAISQGQDCRYHGMGIKH